MKIKVVKLDGTQATLGAYLLRWLLGLLERGLIAFIAVLVSKKGQRLGDMAAGTTVIKLKTRINLKDTLIDQLKEDEHYTVVFQEVSRLSDNDVAIIKEVIKAANTNDNEEALQKLSTRVQEVMGIQTTLSPIDFLKIVLKDYQHYNFDK